MGLSGGHQVEWEAGTLLRRGRAFVLRTVYWGSRVGWGAREQASALAISCN